MSKATVIPHNGGGSADLPAGVIVMWSGAANAIPGGWALCDGSNGTPDLRGRFIVGAGDAYAVGDTGGAESVTLTVAQIPAHKHSLEVINGPSGSGGDGGLVGYGAAPQSANGSTTTSAGGGKSHENRPPYYALCYIMKL